MKEYVKHIDTDDIEELLKSIDLSTTFMAQASNCQCLKVYSNSDVCKLLGINEKLLRKYRYNGLLAFSRVGDKFWYT